MCYYGTRARFGEQLQKLIEPVIRDFIKYFEHLTPRVEIESHRKENSCLVIIRFKKKAYLNQSICSKLHSISNLNTM